MPADGVALCAGCVPCALLPIISGSECTARLTCSAHCSYSHAAQQRENTCDIPKCERIMCGFGMSMINNVLQLQLNIEFHVQFPNEQLFGFISMANFPAMSLNTETMEGRSLHVRCEHMHMRLRCKNLGALSHIRLRPHIFFKHSTFFKSLQSNYHYRELAMHFSFLPKKKLNAMHIKCCQ